jgi:hypothetical protein
MSLLRNINKYVEWDEQRKMFVPRYWRKEILPFTMYFDSTDLNNVDVPVPAAGIATPPFTMKERYDSLEGLDQNLGTPFEVRNLMFTDTTDGTDVSNVTVLMKEVGEVRQFMNRPIHIRTIAGPATTPLLLREPFMFKSQHNVSIQFQKVSGGPTTLRFYLDGVRYYPWSPEFMAKPQAHRDLTNIIRAWYKRRNYVTPFWLTTDTPVELDANGTAQFFSKIGDDGHVELFTYAAVSDGNFRIEISEPKTKQTLMNGEITQRNGIGTANFPTLLPSSYLLPAGYRLRYVITDLSGAPNQIFWTMGGRKIFAPFVGATPGFYRRTAVPTPADSPALIVPSPVGV